MLHKDWAPCRWPCQENYKTKASPRVTAYIFNDAGEFIIIMFNNQIYLQ